ncbi:MAG: Ig-like domain repeat protein [Proteobacteria bacterium]|nr:Ig-like domain repeat protein [Pseudomonadota bacterium]
MSSTRYGNVGRFAGFIGLVCAALVAALVPTRNAAALDIAAGSQHACAITAAHGVKCWGSDGAGQLGDGLGTPNIPKGPVDVVGLSGPVISIVAGALHTCALISGGAVQCWGNNSSGQLGNGDTAGAQQNSPVNVVGLGSGVVAISASGGQSGNHTCALKTTGAMVCWGDNGYGQLGNGDTSGANQYSPVAVSGLGSGVAAISAGSYHSCAVTTAGAAKCWGWNLVGQLGDGLAETFAYSPVQVTGLTSGVASISASPGNYPHTCALMTSGAVKCWGNNQNGESGTGDTSTPQYGTPQQVSGLTSGITAIATGGSGLGYNSFTCALNASAQMLCWGGSQNPSSPVIGNGYGFPVYVPTAVIGLTNKVTEMALGQDFACALDATGHIYCWGDDQYYGQFGDPTQYGSGPAAGTGPYGLSYVPLDVFGLSNGATKVSVGNGWACSSGGAGTAQCWGNNPYLNLGNGDSSYASQAAPSLVSNLTGITAITSSGEGGHNCAITAVGAAYCWGNGGNGQLGTGNTLGSATPVAVSGLGSGVSAIAEGYFHTCAVVNGAAMCWGYNSSGALGNGDTTGAQQNAPVAVTGLGSGVTAIAAGFTHSCAVVSGAAKCWGDNMNGVLGNGDTTGANQFTPVGVTGLSSGVTAIATSQDHTCALTIGGAVLCWGENSYGELGNGDITGATQYTPVQVSGLTSGVKAIAVADFESCAITSANALVCWGSNSSGQLGNGDTSGANQLTPVAVSGLGSGVVAVALGGNSNPANACAVRNSGAVSCWGSNGAGQLGIGYGPSVTYPVNPVPGTPFGTLTVTSITPPANNTYSLRSGNSTLTFVANMSQTATVVGSPRIPITLNSGTVYANYVSGSGTNALTFTYTVGVGDSDTNGIALVSPIDLNGGYIHAGEVYTDGTFTPPNTTGILVDGIPPTITSTVPADTTPTVAATVHYTVTFSEPVTGVTLSDFALTTSGGVSGASLTSVSGSGTSWTVTANTGSNSGTLRLDGVAFQTLTDVDGGNAMRVGYTAGTPYTINRATTTSVTPTPNPSVVGQNVSIGWTVTPAVSGGTFAGTVNVNASTGETCSGAVGAGSCNLVFANSGSRTISATYSGGGSYLGSATTSSPTQVVNKDATTTAISSATPNPVVVGQSYTVSGTVTVNAPGSSTPTGMVTVKDGSGTGSASSTCTVSSGAFSCSLTSISAGAKTLTATYGGDGNNLSSSGTGTQTVNKDATTAAIGSISPSGVVTGQSYTISGTVSVSTPGAGTPTGTMTVSDGSATGACSLSAGAYSCSLASTSVGSKTISATYGGDANDLGSSANNGSQTVAQAQTTTTISTLSADPAVIGQSYTISGSVVVKAPGSGTPTGTVTVGDGSATSAPCTLSAGAFSCTLASTSAGAKTLTATYAGDANYLGSSGTHAQTINKDATATTIASVAPNPAGLGQAYVVSGTVSVSAPGAGTVTGTVTVSDGTALATCSLNSGAYSCNLTSFTAGAKTLTATYSGDTNNLTSSTTSSQQINKAATTTAIGNVTPDPVVVGQSYTVSGTVSVVTPGIGTPTGTVTVSDGSASTTCTLSSGAFSCALTSASAGAKSITATYGGDGNYSTSNGSGTQQVNAAGILQIVPTGPAFAQFGKVITYSILVTNSGGSTVSALVKDNLPAVDFVAGSASWTCVAAGSASCGNASGSGNLGDNATVPVSGTVTYLLTATILTESQLAVDSITNSASAEDSATTNLVAGAVDTQLVLFRNGFESGGNGALDAVASAIGNSEVLSESSTASIPIGLPPGDERSPATIARGLASGSEVFRVEAVRVESHVLIHLIASDTPVEHARAWIDATGEARVALGLATAADGEHLVLASAHTTQDIRIGGANTVALYLMETMP